MAMSEFREEYMQERMKFKTVCGMCGHEISFYQIASALDGTITDYSAKDVMDISGYLCEECTTKLVHFMRKQNGGDANV